MRRMLMLVALIGSLSIGCGSGKNEPLMIKAKGQVMRGGTNFKPDEGQSLQICLIPIEPDGSPPKSWYAAQVNQETGSFYARGGHNQGMPPGKYRATVELRQNRKDTLKGKFNAANSPFVFEIEDESDVMEIDLEDPPAKT